MPRPRSFELQDAVKDAMMVFWRQGYEATSVEDLVAATGLNRSSLYATFQDKHALFLLVLRLYCQGVVNKTATLLADSSSTKEAFAHACDEVIAAGISTRNWGCLLVNSVTELLPKDPQVREISRQYSSDIQHLIQTSLERDQRSGRLSVGCSPEELALYLFNALQGLKVLVKTLPDPTVLKTICAYCVLALQ